MQTFKVRSKKERDIQTCAQAPNECNQKHKEQKEAVEANPPNHYIISERVQESEGLPKMQVLDMTQQMSLDEWSTTIADYIKDNDIRFDSGRVQSSINYQESSENSKVASPVRPSQDNNDVSFSYERPEPEFKFVWGYRPNK